MKFHNLETKFNIRTTQLRKNIFIYANYIASTIKLMNLNELTGFFPGNNH